MPTKTRPAIVREYIQRRGQNDLCLCAAHLADIDAEECSDGDDPDFCQIDIIDAAKELARRSLNRMFA